MRAHEVGVEFERALARGGAQVRTDRRGSRANSAARCAALSLGSSASASSQLRSRLQRSIQFVIERRRAARERRRTSRSSSTARSKACIAESGSPAPRSARPSANQPNGISLSSVSARSALGSAACGWPNCSMRDRQAEMRGRRIPDRARSRRDKRRRFARRPALAQRAAEGEMRLQMVGSDLDRGLSPASTAPAASPESQQRLRQVRSRPRRARFDGRESGDIPRPRRAWRPLRERIAARVRRDWRMVGPDRQDRLDTALGFVEVAELQPHEREHVERRRLARIASHSAWRKQASARVAVAGSITAPARP